MKAFFRILLVGTFLGTLYTLAFTIVIKCCGPAGAWVLSIALMTWTLYKDAKGKL